MRGVGRGIIPSMNKYIFLFIMTVAVIYLAGCQTNHLTRPTTPIIDGHTSRIALDWYGTYHGILPCADCTGIETWLTLESDLTYRLQTRYLGKDDRIFENHGHFIWKEDGNTIHLQGIPDGPDHYHVGENRLFQLDQQGQKIHGTLAEHYFLDKIE